MTARGGGGGAPDESPGSAPDETADAAPAETPNALEGRGIIAAAWVGDLVFAATAIPASVGLDAFDDPAVAVALALFFASLGVWIWTLVAAAVRTARGDEVVVASLFLLEGRPPGRVRMLLAGALVVCLVVTVATAAANPFGVLVPMFPLGLIGLWGARHGSFPPRRARATRSR